MAGKPAPIDPVPNAITLTPIKEGFYSANEVPRYFLDTQDIGGKAINNRP
jgi:hypothetical protein